MSTLPHIQTILTRLSHVKPAGAGHEARCPAHDDRQASLSVNVGKDDRALVYCHAGCTTHAILSSIGLRLADLFPVTDKKPRIVATYDYVDEQGELLYQVCRFEPKDFRQRRPDPDKPGKFLWNLTGVRRVLYRLPELLASDGTVYVVEGEKDADALYKLGLVATCNVGGAGNNKWHKEYSATLAGRDVVVIADKDSSGRAHAHAVAKSLTGVAASVRVIEVSTGKDAADYVAQGGSLAELQAIANAAPTFDPTTKPTTDTPATDKIMSDISTAPTEAEIEPGDIVPLGEKDPQSGKYVLSPRKTVPTASAYIREFHTHEDGRTLTTYSGVPFVWRNNRHEPIEQQAIEQKLYPWLHDSLRYVMNRKTEELELVDFEANPSTVKAALQTILSQTYLANEVEPPVWHPADPTRLPADELLVCKSCSVHLPTLKTIPPTPRLFVTASLDFDYDENATEPKRWLAFLSEVFSGDQHSIFLLQQWFGYCLTMNTRQQKMLLMIGPKRSGKGTVARILRRLIGMGNVAGPTVGSLAGPFGLQPLIGKSLAIVSDARFAGDGVSSVVERLLCISGEDTLTIDRKFLPSVTMKLPTRFTFLTNEPPRLSDASGALAGRFMVLRFTQSFYGREDINLDNHLNAELPGILKWAIEGWHFLRAQGHFIEPTSSQDLVEEMEDSMSPIGAFVRDRCVVDAEQRIWVKDIYDAWKDWCKEQGRDHPGTVQSFSRDLRSFVSTVQVHKGTDGTRFYAGVGLAVRV